MQLKKLWRSNLISMGSYMIWKIIFKDEICKKSFEARMDNKCIHCKLMHDHYEKDDAYENCDFIYDMGYLGYTESREMKKELQELGIIELNEIYLCDIDGEKIITP